VRREYNRSSEDRQQVAEMRESTESLFLRTRERKKIQLVEKSSLLLPATTDTYA